MENLICCKCGVALVEENVKFSYLNREMTSKVPKCPKCGQVYISYEMVRDKVKQVEMMLEEK